MPSIVDSGVCVCSYVYTVYSCIIQMLLAVDNAGTLWSTSHRQFIVKYFNMFSTMFYFLWPIILTFLFLLFIASNVSDFSQNNVFVGIVVLLLLLLQLLLLLLFNRATIYSIYFLKKEKYTHIFMDSILAEIPSAYQQL